MGFWDTAKLRDRWTCVNRIVSERVCNRLKSKRFVEGAAGKTEEKLNSGHFVINIFVPLTQVVTNQAFQVRWLKRRRDVLVTARL